MIQIASLLTTGPADMSRGAGISLATTSGFALALAEVAALPASVAAVAWPPGDTGSAPVTIPSARQMPAATGKTLPSDSPALPIELFAVPESTATAVSSTIIDPAAPTSPIAARSKPKSGPNSDVSLASMAVDALTPHGGTPDILDTPVSDADTPVSEEEKPTDRGTGRDDTQPQPPVAPLALPPAMPAVVVATTPVTNGQYPAPVTTPSALPIAVHISAQSAERPLVSTVEKVAPRSIADGATAAMPHTTPPARIVPQVPLAQGERAPRPIAGQLTEAPGAPLQASRHASDPVVAFQAAAVAPRHIAEAVVPFQLRQYAPAPTRIDPPVAAAEAVAHAVRTSPEFTPQAMAPVMPQPAAQAFAAAMFDAASRSGDREDNSSPAPPAIVVLNGPAAPQPAGEMTPAAAAQPPIDLTRQDWMNTMIERIETLQGDGGAREARIRLTPDALGTIDLTIAHDDDGALQVRFVADTQAARTILADAAPRLAEMADARGLKLGQAGVEAGTGQQHQQGRRDTPQSDSAAPNRASGFSAAGDDTGETDTRLA